MITSISINGQSKSNKYYVAIKRGRKRKRNIRVKDIRKVGKKKFKIGPKTQKICQNQ